MLLDLQDVAQTLQLLLKVQLKPQTDSLPFDLYKTRLALGNYYYKQCQGQGQGLSSLNMRHNICKPHSCPQGEWPGQGHMRHCGISL